MNTSPLPSAPAMIIIATHAEAKAILQECANQNAIANYPSDVWSDGYATYDLAEFNARLLITGIGRDKVVASIKKYFETYSEPKEIWNLGIAAALDRQMPLDGVYAVHLVEECDENEMSPIGKIYQVAAPTFNSEKLFESKTSYTLLTSLIPRFDFEGTIANTLLDMEAYHIVKTLEEISPNHIEKLHIIKIVSDYASSGDRQNIRERLPLLSQKIHELSKGIFKPKDED